MQLEFIQLCREGEYVFYWETEGMPSFAPKFNMMDYLEKW